MGNKSAKNQIAAGQADKRAAEGALNSFEYGQQQGGLSNPFANTTNAFAGLTNQFANQRVATGASEFQKQANDESTANILDAVVQGGGGAATSATALARQAQKGNQQIAAGLQGQEQQISQQSAQGQANVDQLKAQGEQRRQQLVGSGAQYVQGVSEARDTAKLSGLGNQLAGAQQTINAGYKSISDNNAAWIKGVTGLAGSVLTAGAGGGAGGAWGFGGK